jgi:hypothetical protein
LTSWLIGSGGLILVVITSRMSQIAMTGDDYIQE